VTTLSIALANLATSLPEFLNRPDLACHPTRKGAVFSNAAVDDGRTREAREAIVVCLSCPGRKECRDYAVQHGEQGLWGGTTDKDRERMRRGARPVNYVAARCAHCRTLFARTYGAKQLYCSKTCRSAAYYARRKVAA
jgi:WhiB family redox-sensing transcriptional regulator